jgi:pilus assembly protein CpaE
MAERIRVLIVDDNDDTRDGTRRLLEYEDNIDIVGFADNGQTAVEQARELKPSVILMDINMPVMDGLQATEIIKRELPATQIIVVSVQDDAHYMRQAFQKGAFDFVAKPITSAELSLAIERASRQYEVDKNRAAPVPADPRTPSSRGPEERVRPRGDANGKVIAVMGFKGGVGKTTVAVSLGIGLAKMMPDKKVLIIDGNLLFGDIGVFLNTRGSYTVLHAVDLLSEPEGVDAQSMDNMTVSHESGARLLLAPSNPNEAGNISADQMVELLSQLRREFHYIVLDTPTTFDQVSGAAIRAANKLIVLTTPTMPALKDARLLFNELQSAEFNKDNIILVLNEVDKTSRITAEQIGNFLKHPADAQLPADPLAIEAVNQGIPLIAMDSRKSVAVKPLTALVQMVREQIEAADMPATEQPSAEPRKRSVFGIWGS